MSGGNNYLEETVKIFSFLINKYLLDFEELLEQYKKQIPVDFDLSEIFED